MLYASALHNKDIQGPDIADILPPQPAHAPLWFGPIEAGDTRRFIANGYVHVICAAARLGEVRRPLRRRGHRPLRHDRMDHAAAVVATAMSGWSASPAMRANSGARPRRGIRR